MVRIKVCGLTSYDDALLAEELGADALGFIFTESPRRIEPETARDIIAALPPFVHKVGVFVDAQLDEILNIVDQCRLTAVQLHGSETPQFCRQMPVPVIKSFRVGPGFSVEHISDYRVDAILLDTFDPKMPGGTGKSFDWQIAKKARSQGRLVLSGGLNPINIIEAIETVKPYAVDVCSGIESEPGIKNKYKLRSFMERVKIYGL